MNRKDTALLRKLGACEEALEWCKAVPDLETAWNTCKRSDWMMWALDAIGYKDDKALRLYACACVRSTPLSDGRTVWDLMTDKRSRNAVEVSERYANGQATYKELAAARAAAWAAWAAAWAAWDAAWAAWAAGDAFGAAAWAARAAAWAAWAARDAARDASGDASGAAAWDAAGAAAWAARAAAGDAAGEWQANRLREFMSWNDVAKTIAEKYHGIRR